MKIITDNITIIFNNLYLHRITLARAINLHAYVKPSATNYRLQDRRNNAKRQSHQFIFNCCPIFLSADAHFCLNRDLVLKCLSLYVTLYSLCRC